MVWLINALTGKIMASLAGHDADVTFGMFSQHDQNKHIVSSSADCTLKVWKPLQNECILTVRPRSDKKYHATPILCFALHPEMPLAISGDESGQVFACHIMTGEIVGCIGEHKDSVESIIISASNQIAASAGMDSKILVFDLKDQNCAIKFCIEPTVYGGYS